MNINITELHKIYPKRIHSPAAEIKPIEEEFAFSVPLDYVQGPYVITAEFEQAIAFNRLLLDDLEFKEEFKIAVHVSPDGLLWQRTPLIHFQRSPNSAIAEFPLTQAKAAQIVFSSLYDSGVPSFQVKKAKFQCYAKPILKASSEENRLWVAENLIDGRDDYGWASAVHDKQSSDVIDIDFGQVFYLDELRLKAVKELPNCFPVNFSLLASLDKSEWQTLLSESDFYAVAGSWYSWRTQLMRCRYLKLVIDKHFQKKKDQFLSRILEAAFFALPENQTHETEKKSLPTSSLASEAIPGVITFAPHNAAVPHKAVQGNDPRLREASSEYAGIVRLAKDGEEREKLVVQSTDARLKNSTTERVGLVRLANDKEETEGRAVQANDSRLKSATHQTAGIVQLAKDKEVNSTKVVLSNDSRLKEGSEELEGIVRFAKDNESLPMRALQSNDSRLKNAGVAWAGIVQLAQHGETVALKALQSDDPRLKEGDESLKGRVIFAKDKESTPLKALQSNDSRLKNATQKEYGFSVFAAHGESASLKAVQADDPRLENARTPLPHTHEYAPMEHELNNHRGKLNLNISEEHSPLAGIEVSLAARYPLSVNNPKGYAALFQGGVVSRSEISSSVLALGDKVTGVEARTRDANAAVFLSEKETALYLPNAIGSLRGSGKSLKVEGSSEFYSEVHVAARALAVLWKKSKGENFSEGDILTLDDDGCVKKISDARQIVVGVYSRRHVGLLLKNKDEKDVTVPVAIEGITKVRIRGHIKTGDKVGFFFGDAGIGKRLEKNMETAVVGIALETAGAENETLVECLLRFR